MALRLKDIQIPVGDTPADDLLPQAVSAYLGIGVEDIRGLRIVKKSLDARRKSRIIFHYQLDVEVLNEEQVFKGNQSRCELSPQATRPNPLNDLPLGSLKFRHRPVIIGSGPAGTFAALTLAEAGQPAIVIERGEPVEQRLRTVNRLRRGGEFARESNYCFGEGGAGTFSDGKLTCGRNHPLIRYIFQRWVDFGAPEQILYDAHPHIGTDFLMMITKRIRAFLEEIGTEFHFSRRWVDMNPGQGGRYEVTLDNGDQLLTDHLIVAIGHSARDTYDMILAKNVAITPKPFAIGARFEHPQEVIDKIQFGNCTLLPAAEYKLAAQNQDRGIWTFCMCPGGHLLPTSSEEGHLAINGMSYHARNSGFANAAVVVNVRREDFYRDHPLDGVKFQRAIEQRAFREGGGNYFTPAQRLVDFLEGRKSKGELISTYKPGVTSARLDQILPDFVVGSLRSALKDYNQKMHGFIHPEALVAGVETKTSAPIMMTRDKSLQSVSHPGLFPAGEGAGFAGGIVSAALDGVRVGRAVLESTLSQVFTG